MSESQGNVPDAEAQADAILDEALKGVNLNTDGTICPQGDECPVHYRLDDELIDEETEFGRLINYVGEYVVITTDNPELENPILLLKMILGQITDDQLPPLYETIVLHVGAEGVLADLRDASKEARRSAIRFLEQHESWANFKSAHQGVLEGVKSGLIDLSQPVPEKE